MGRARSPAPAAVAPYIDEYFLSLYFLTCYLHGVELLDRPLYDAEDEKQTMMRFLERHGSKRVACVVWLAE